MEPLACAGQARGPLGHAETEAIRLQVHLGSVEWQGPTDAVIEAGASINGQEARHWIWRLGRDGSAWRVLCCEVVWSAPSPRPTGKACVAGRRMSMHMRALALSTKRV